MKRIITIIALAAAAAAHAQRAEPKDTITLYRNSSVSGGENWRLHVATFDATVEQFRGTVADYNRGNCEIARGLFQAQPGVEVRYWCEAGTVRATTKGNK